MEKFTKIYKTERELLRKTGSVNAYEVYMHLKDSSSYYKEDFYDLTKCVAEYIGIPERPVKDAIKRLKEVGLIEISKRGKVNIYKLPYAQQKVETHDKKEQESVNGVKTELFKVAAVKESINELRNEVSYLNENTGDFIPEIPKDDTRVQQDIESVLKGQETGKNGVFDIPSDVAEKIKAVTSNSSLEINEKYKGIGGILKPYLRNVPSRKHSEIVDFFYKQFNEAA